MCSGQRAAQNLQSISYNIHLGDQAFFVVGPGSARWRASWLKRDWRGNRFRANLPTPVLEHAETTQQKHLHTTKRSTPISRLSYCLPPATSCSGSLLQSSRLYQQLTMGESRYDGLLGYKNLSQHYFSFVISTRAQYGLND